MAQTPSVVTGKSYSSLELERPATTAPQFPSPVTFTNITAQTGINFRHYASPTSVKYLPETMGAGIALIDYDNDGRLDIFVGRYVEWDFEKGSIFCGDPRPGYRAYCHPDNFKPSTNVLFHQKADGTFEDVSDKTGVTDEGNYYGFASVFVDVNDDQKPDLLVVNDSTPKQLYINKGDGTFEEVGYPSGIALSETGREQAGMGLAVGDYDNDGRVDFHITNFSDDSNTLYRNDGEANFTDVTYQAGIGEPTIPFLGWGTEFLDFDNDGWKDLIVANGHIYSIVDNFQWGTSEAQQILLFKNVRNAKDAKPSFDRVPAAPNSGLAESIKGRELAFAHFDGDGRLDVLIANSNSEPTLLRNVADTKNNWLEIKLADDVAKKNPADGIGSCVCVTTGNLRQRFDATSGASCASQSSQIIHVGLGNNAKIDELKVIWSNGQTEKFLVDKINTQITIKQGSGSPM